MKKDEIKIYLFEFLIGAPLMILYDWFPPFKRYLDRRGEHILALLDRLFFHD